jgi:hypothetical protein
MAGVEYFLKIDGLSKALKKELTNSMPDPVSGGFELVSFSLHQHVGIHGSLGSGSASGPLRAVTFEARASNEVISLAMARPFLSAPEGWKPPPPLDPLRLGEALLTTRFKDQLRLTITFYELRVHYAYSMGPQEIVYSIECSFDRMKSWSPEYGTMWTGSDVPAGDMHRVYRREDWNRLQARALLNRSGLA